MKTDDDVLDAVAARVTSARESPPFPPATREIIADAERRLGFALPPFYTRLLMRVGNGGFGPGFGIFGLSPTGYADEQILESVTGHYVSGRVEPDERFREPYGLLLLCHWGCAKFSHLDCATEAGRVITSEANGEGEDLYNLTAPSLREWMAKWADGVDLASDMVETVGYRDGKNPFTGAPHRYPVTRMKGEALDLTERKRDPRGR